MMASELNPTVDIVVKMVYHF